MRSGNVHRSDCMKILYIAQEHCAAQVAARALSRIAPNVRLSWASSPEAAIGWIRDNRDAQAVIAETGREDPAFDALLEQVRGIGVTTPIAAVAPEHLDALSAALEANLEVLATEERQRVLQDQDSATQSWHAPTESASASRSSSSSSKRRFTRPASARPRRRRRPSNWYVARRNCLRPWQRKRRFAAQSSSVSPLRRSPARTTAGSTPRRSPP